jgi:eukaryotic-like serine/threonine-protein kinase
MSMIGKAIAHYEITSQLGKGGMGEVYRAKDLKLGRDVAIKVLPEEFARDADRVARFQREAKLLASLNHPNIAAIYGLEESSGTNFLVLELVEGETLADRINAGPVPVEEALKLALQIAEALEAAHEKGVIHRDLKPANINVTPDGKVKVLDFGLAKAFAGEQVEMNLSNSPTLSDMATQQGIILGTAAYMSPEQAKGKAVDKRADIWAFGVVLFEMLTGGQVFTGETVSDTLASVLAREPKWQSLPSNLHPRIRLLLERCLKKEPKDRYGSISDGRVDIQDALADPGGVLVQPVMTAEPRTRLRTILPWIAAALLLGLIIAGIAIWRLKPTEPRQVMRFAMALPGTVTFTAGEYPLRSAIISPDGQRIVFTGIDQSTGRARLYVRPIDSIDAMPMQGSEEGFDPFWSPDSRSIGFFAHGKLERIDLQGGAPQIICEAQSGGGGSWSKDDVILASLSNPGPLSRVSAGGGEPTAVTSFDASSEVDHDWPQFTEDGKHFLYMSWGRTARNNAIYLGSLDSQSRKLLMKGVTAFIYAHPDTLMFLRDRTLLAQSFDRKKFELIGQPVPIAENASSPFSASQNGTVTYRTLKAGPNQFLWIKQDGTDIGTVIPPAYYVDPALSPDGSKLAFASRESPGTGYDIWILDFASGVLRRFTLDSANNRAPHWSLDGKTIVFLSSRPNAPGLYQKNSNGVGEEKLMLLSKGVLWPYQMSPDGRSLLYFAGVSGANDVMLMSLNDLKSTPLIQTRFNEVDGALSPDQRWLAYVSNESGPYEIYLTTFPPSSTKLPATSNGGCDPVWNKDGKQLFYVNSSTDELWSVAVKSGTPPEFGTPRRIHPGPLDYATAHSFALDPKGERILIAQSWAMRGEITILINWKDLLKKQRTDN